jgi:hypothetical protein
MGVVARSAQQRAEAFSILYAAMGIGWGLSGFAVSALLGPVGASGAITVAAAVAVLCGLAAQFVASRSGRCVLTGRPAVVLAKARLFGCQREQCRSSVGRRSRNGHRLQLGASDLLPARRYVFGS